MAVTAVGATTALFSRPPSTLRSTVHVRATQRLGIEKSSGSKAIPNANKNVASRSGVGRNSFEIAGDNVCFEVQVSERVRDRVLPEFGMPGPGQRSDEWRLNVPGTTWRGLLNPQLLPERRLRCTVNDERDPRNVRL